VTFTAALLLLLQTFEPQVTLATDLLYHWASREATATVGYDVTLRQARLQGKVDSAGGRVTGIVNTCTQNQDP
jgi:mitochondrial import receptor subunit TOM40